MNIPTDVRTSARKFVAPTSREALRLARQALGDEAIVLTNRVTAEGVEIVAMVQEDVEGVRASAAAAPPVPHPLPAAMAAPAPAIASIATPAAVPAPLAADSVLGGHANPDGRGLLESYSYVSLVQTAFQPEYWEVPDPAENFPLFFGLAVQAYQATLVSDDSRFDRFSDGDGSALTAQEQLGMRLFQTRECTDCHTGPEFTIASFTGLRNRGRV